MKVLIDSHTINEVLDVPYISNVDYIDKAPDMNMVWILKTFISKEFREQFYLTSTQGITSNYFWLMLGGG